MKARLYDPRVRRVLTIDPILSGLTGGAWNASTYMLKQQVDRHDPASLLTGKGQSDHWQPQPQEADPEDGKAPQGGSLLQDPLKGNTPALALPSDEAYQPAIGSSPVNAGTSDSFGEQASAASPATPTATTVSDEGYAPDSGEWGTVEQKTRDPGTFGGSKANPYAYSFNNPVTYVDPDGEFVLTSTAIGWGVAALAVGAYAVGKAVAPHAATAAQRAYNQLKDGAERLADSFSQARAKGPGNVVNEGGVRVDIYSGDHGPPHAHVKSGDRNTRVGQNGKPLKGEGELTKQEEKVVRQHLKGLRNRIRDTMKQHKENEQ